MRRMAILGISVLGALAIVATVSAASGPKATGDVTWLGGSGNDTVIHAIFTAQGTADSAKGQVSLWTPTAYWTGTVTCYYQSGNSARFSGIVTSHTDSNNSGFFEIQVTDNGEGTNATAPDTIGTIRYATDPANATCGTNTFSHPIEIAGNLQVH